MLKLIYITVIALILLPVASYSSAGFIKLKVLCYQTETGKVIPAKSQPLFINLFEKGKKQPRITTNSKGYLIVPASYKNKQFRLNVIADGMVIPGCTSGTIKKFSTVDKVQMQGVDCGYLKCNQLKK